MNPAVSDAKTLNGLFPGNWGLAPISQDFFLLLPCLFLRTRVLLGLSLCLTFSFARDLFFLVLTDGDQGPQKWEKCKENGEHSPKGQDSGQCSPKDREKVSHYTTHTVQSDDGGTMDLSFCIQIYGPTDHKQSA